MARFHAHSGWHFERLEGGCVRISRQSHAEADHGGETSWSCAVVFDADTWASIVASVSPGGDTAETFHAAEALHAGGVR